MVSNRKDNRMLWPRWVKSWEKQGSALGISKLTRDLGKWQLETTPGPDRLARLVMKDLAAAHVTRIGNIITTTKITTDCWWDQRILIRIHGDQTQPTAAPACNGLTLGVTKGLAVGVSWLPCISTSCALIFCVSGESVVRSWQCRYASQHCHQRPSGFSILSSTVNPGHSMMQSHSSLLQGVALIPMPLSSTWLNRFLPKILLPNRELPNLLQLWDMANPHPGWFRL